MIDFIEKEPFESYDNWNNCKSLLYPNVMVKEGKEYFIRNRREPYESNNHRGLPEVIHQLKENNGSYATFYSPYIQPMDFLNSIIEYKYSFDRRLKIFEEYKEGNFVDFSRKS